MYSLKTVERNEFGKLEGEILKTAGWGKIYDEVTKNGKTLTSCMTDQNGPQPNNFHPCVVTEVIRSVILLILTMTQYYIENMP